MEMSPKKVLDSFIQENISPLMKKSGFLKTGKTWTKQNGDITYVMNIQSSKWNVSGAPIEVFINYGIYSPQQYRKQFKTSPLPKYPKEYDCYIRNRLMNSGDSSEIWTISINGLDTSKVGIENAIREIILPFFETY